MKAMGHSLRLLREEFRRIREEPKRVRKLADPRARRRLFRTAFPGVPTPVRSRSTEGLAKREYRTYQDYVDHQASKLELLDLDDYEQTFEAALSTRLSHLDVRGMRVLCLAARRGAEVRAFISNGAFAVGLDLNPGPDNSWVLPGDFHRLQFADNSVDLVYTNSVDHVLDLSRFLGEVERVLVPGGSLMIEAMVGAQERNRPFGSWEVLEWDTLDDLIAAILPCGFVETGRRPFASPWKGEAIHFRCDPARNVH